MTSIVKFSAFPPNLHRLYKNKALFQPFPEKEPYFYTMLFSITITRAGKTIRRYNESVSSRFLNASARPDTLPPLPGPVFRLPSGPPRSKVFHRLHSDKHRLRRALLT